MKPSPLIAVPLALIFVLAGTTPVLAADPDRRRWTATWSAAMQEPVSDTIFIPPNWSEDGFDDQSVRQVMRTSQGGSEVRVRLSNRFGERPLRIASATIGRAGDGAAVRPGSLRALRFDHRSSTAIPLGADRSSDPVRLSVRPLERLTVTLYLAEPTGPSTFHFDGLTTTYRADGDHASDIGAGAYAGETSSSRFYVTGLDVAGGQGTVVTLGDSITDGDGSTPGTDRRYPDQLAKRLLASGRAYGIANAGLTGNLMLTDNPCFGQSAITRFQRDVAEQPGVRTVIVLLGINDIGGRGVSTPDCGSAPDITADDLIVGHRELIRSARSRGITAIGATMTPIKGTTYGWYTPENEAIRDEVNTWIRNSGEYDAVVDLDRALADPDDPDALRPEYAAEDRLHPNDAGMRAIAAAIDLDELE
jgi:lysophospholipase L1-like esterase